MKKLAIGCLVLLAATGFAELHIRQNLTAVSTIPICAQTCLSNSTATQGSCSNLDVQCLCANQEYVNSLSCCLATQCDESDQQKAIAFNQQECESVGETAPGFVGCSPFGLSSFVILGSSATTAPVSTINPSPATTTSIAISTVNSLITTVTGATETDFGWATVVGSKPVTATYSGSALLTGSCTVPNFALATNSANASFLYPEIGCSPDRENCCPFNAHEYALLPECPIDYFTTGNACCPTGYRVYPTNLGYETPCYSIPSITLIPASTPSITGLTVINDAIFTRKYLLDPAALPHHGLSAGGIIGIAVGIPANILIFGALIWWMRRKSQARRHAPHNPFIPRTEEMAEPTLASRPSELASPRSQPVTPHSASTRSDWPIARTLTAIAAAAAAPPAYETMAAGIPHELPGSTYIFEHHPAFSDAGGSEGARSTTTSPPMTPTKSSAVSPNSTAERGGPVSPPIISPMASPKLI